jgi:hypothetical protein
MTSDSLINVADRYVDLDSIKEEIQKTPRSYTYRPLYGVSVLEDAREEDGNRDRINVNLD